ncbi:hypothetical protein Zmor_000211 [Zophobas morio]|uniref:Uncharacterized protein n=1 Tax=Zophobas morio TaxID=2755281 RepID=A0AA38IYV2_9CUCU|nr:hypothetical protein Zmor_000211 [Zophobas morio]
MSPASSGTLEVEKYIGACLISQQRPKSRDFYRGPPEAAYPNYVNYRVQRCGGMPLISFAGQKRAEENPLARLAVHTQGAPLILTKNFNRRKKKEQKKPDGADAVSVASDESSGSGNSDNCLPRIIKPRKRRKKDRKPPRSDGFSTDSASPDIDVPILHPYPPFVFGAHYTLVPDPPEEETPQLHHSFEDVEESDGVDINGNQTVCQCRYCDPSGQIWDVDRSCYSPFLTTPKTFFESFLSTYTPPDCLAHRMSSVSLEDDKKSDSKTPASPGDLEVSTEIVTSLNGHRDIEIKFFSSSSADGVRALPKNRDRILTCVNKECTELDLPETPNA